MKYRNAVAFSLLFLCSCERKQTVSGVVVDKTTGTPMIGVRISLNAPAHMITHTDSIGGFLISSSSRGFGRHSPMKLYWNKEGYKQALRLYDTNVPNDTIWMEHQ